MTDPKTRCPTCGDDGTADPCFCSDGFHAPVLAEFRPPVAQQEAQGLVEIVARAIMEAKGGCEVKDWAAEERDNPHVELTMKQARAAITAQASQLEEAVKALRECPFCKAAQASSKTDLSGVWLEKDDHDDPEYHVQCWGCGAQGKGFQSSEKAIAAWNTRPPVAQQEAQGLVDVQGRTMPLEDKLSSFRAGFAAGHRVLCRYGRANSGLRTAGEWRVSGQKDREYFVSGFGSAIAMGDTYDSQRTVDAKMDAARRAIGLATDNSLGAFKEANRMYGDIDQRSFDAGYAATRREFSSLAHKANGTIEKLLLYVDDFCKNDSHVLDAKDLQYKLRDAARD